MQRVILGFAPLLFVLTAAACGDDDGPAPQSDAGADSGTDTGTLATEGMSCDTVDDCADGLSCVPRATSGADPLFCARGCTTHANCAIDERCVAYCDPSESGCTDHPEHCSLVVNTAWEACGSAITSSCGETSTGASLVCLTSGGDLGLCAQLCEFGDSGQCPNGQVCSDQILASTTTGVCAMPRTRGQSCDPYSGSVCGSDDFCASLVDPSGAGFCRQLCGPGFATCEGETECTVFAQIGNDLLSACFPTSSSNQDAGI